MCESEWRTWALITELYHILEIESILGAYNTHTHTQSLQLCEKMVNLLDYGKSSHDVHLNHSPVMVAQGVVCFCERLELHGKPGYRSQTNENVLDMHLQS